MSKRVTLLLAGLGLALLSLGYASVVLTSAPARAADQASSGPFMGMADPNAPYDQRFIDEMVMHHQGAIMSSAMMIGNSQRSELRDLARRIQESQQRQIDQMRVWRLQWYGSADSPTTDACPMMSSGMMSGGMMGGHGMGGMMGSQGRDRMFLRMMIPHHQLAIDMAQDALSNAEHPELKQLAREIIADQSAEIAEMEGYLQAWYGEGSTRDVAGSMRDMMRRMMGR